MSTDDDDDNKSPPKRVVVTHYGKKRKSEDEVPSEIAPKAPTQILSSPVDVGQGDTPKIAEPPQQPEPQKPREAIPRPIEVPVFKAQKWESKVEKTEKTEKAEVKSPGNRDNDIPPPPVEEKKRQGVGTVFFSILATAGVFVLVFHAYYSQQEILALQEQSLDDQHSVRALLEEGKKLQAQQIDQQNAMQSMQAQLESEHSRLTSLNGNQDWVLSEVNYLVFMANERLKIAQDVPTAILQLKSAQEKLKTLGNANFAPINTAIEKDLTVLRNVGAPNKKAIWENIESLAAQFNQLQFKFISLPEKEIAQEDIQNESHWRKALWRSWQELKGIISVTKIDDNKIPQALSAKEREQIIQTMKLISLQAQWALLQGESDLYVRNLQSLQKIILQYFDSASPQPEMIATLNQLANQKVDIQLPSLAALEALSSMRAKQ